MVRSGLCYKISLIFSLSPVFDTTSPGVRAAIGDRAGARHGNLTPPRISPSCPHCLCLWLGRSIITRLLTRVGSVFENQSQCETARHRLFCGRMGPLCTFLAVFDAGPRPHRWSSRILQRRFSPLPGASRQRTYPRCRIFTFGKGRAFSMALSLFLRLTPALYKSFFNFFIDSFLRTVWSRLKGLSIGIGGGVR